MSQRRWSPEFVRKEEVEERGSHASTAHYIDEIVMRQVHRRPIKDTGICPNIARRLREEVGKEECFESGVSGMERGECSEYKG